MTFQQLGLIPQILSALKEQGYEKPTPIQRRAIPPALKGQDVLGCAQTGTGKTCAFAAPILQRLYKTHKKGPRSIRALILTPTRELAIQIGECFAAYGKELPLRSAVIFGGVGQKGQVDQIKRGLDILVATPGRLLDLHGQGLLDLLDVETFVLDEADRMLDMGFIHDVRRVLKLLPVKKQTLFFSATMPPEVMELVNALLHDYARVEVDPVSSPVEVIAQSLYYVDKGNKTKLLAHLIGEKKMDSVLVFVRTKHGANRIVQDLLKKGIKAAAIHGNKSQTARQQALADFKDGKLTALVATDIAARGIDIDELNWVVNYDLPEVPETYVHRIGRTGRAGRNGSALSFCRADEKNYLKAIEKLLGCKLPVVEDHPFPMTEPATGVDPMVQARKEGKENARANAALRRQAQEAKAQAAAKQEKPAEKKGNEQPQKEQVKKEQGKKEQTKKNPSKKEQPEKAQTKIERPKKQETPHPKPESKRGVRQQKLEATLPAEPARASGEFTRRDPLAGDVIMDATARLLAPRPRPVVSDVLRPAQGEGKNKGGQSKGKKQTQGQKTAESEKKQGQKSEKPSVSEKKQVQEKKSAQPPPQPKNKKKTGKKQPVKQEQKPVLAEPKKSQNADKKRNSNQKGSEPRRSERPRPVQAPRSRVKDSTEQPSLMKPYYLHDDD